MNVWLSREFPRVDRFMHHGTTGWFDPEAAVGPVDHNDRWARAAWALAAVACLATLGAILLPPALFDPIYTHSSLLIPALPVAATIRAWTRLRARGAAGPWTWVLIGVAGFFAYEVFWYLGRYFASDPTALAADFMNLWFAPAILIGVLRGTPVEVDSKERRRRSLDAVIIAIGAVMLAYAMLVLAGGGGRPVASVRDLVLLASPVIDAATLAGLALLWVRRHSGRLPVWAGTLGLALLITMIGDFWYALPASVGRTSPWFVAGAWYGSWAVIGIGAAQAAGPPRTLALAAGVSRLPYVVAAACYGMFAVAIVQDHHRLTEVMGVTLGVLTGLVLLRQYLALRDVAQIQEHQARAEAESRLAALVRHGSDMLTILDADLRVTYASPSHDRILGIPADWFVGRAYRSQLHADDIAETDRALSRLATGESPRESLSVRIQAASGEWRWIETVATNLFDEPAVGGLVLNGRDISERRELELQLLEQALRDPLTGLANRRLFGDRVAHALARRRRVPGSVAVVLLDLDHFKVVNDSLGHAKGDALLVAVADRLRTVLRSADTIARLGGDEFAVLLEDLAHPDEADHAAERILHALNRPFMLDDREVTVRASIGIAWAGEEQGVDDLLTDADVAMYGAKNSGRACIERFSSAMRASVAERHDVEADLRHALERDEFEVIYQPVVDLKTGMISGAEALVRWHHPTKGVILPGRFIPVAEESDLILAIGRLVLERAARDAARFRTFEPDLRVAVNLSARQLLAADLVQDVVASTEAAGVTGQALTVELTETVLASSERVVTERLQRLRDLGVRVALDDFGTGYSALAYLRHFPIDVLKVDKSFVSWAREDASKDGVTRAIISIGQSLGMRTVAEGVETRDQLAWLRSLGCTYGQGYLFSRPLQAADLATLLADWDPARYAEPDQVALSLVNSDS
ncbi:MAG: putative bifunctional diguanylate cyclase/phosphodiesterase [Gemmatimonadales bacterium]